MTRRTLFTAFTTLAATGVGGLSVGPGGAAAQPVAVPPATAPSTSAAWRPLLDDKLSAFEVWIGSPHDSVTGLPPGTPTSANGSGGKPLGLGNDPKKVFTVRVEDGEPVLYVSGEIYGALSTREDFADFHLRAQFERGETKWEPRLTKPRDNGILYYCTGPHGAFWNVWKRGLEFQVQEQDMGDLYPLSGTGYRRVEITPITGIPPEVLSDAAP